MEPRQCCISRCPEQSIYYIYYLHSYVLTFLLGCLEAVELNWPAHLSCPQTCCCHTEYTLNGASVLTSSLQHPEVVKIYLKCTCIELGVVFTPAEVLTFRFCVLCAKVAKIQHLCFADKRHLRGPGQQRCCSCVGFAVRICRLLFGFYVLSGASISTPS